MTVPAQQIQEQVWQLEYERHRLQTEIDKIEAKIEVLEALIKPGRAQRQRTTGDAMRARVDAAQKALRSRPPMGPQDLALALSTEQVTVTRAMMADTLRRHPHIFKRVGHGQWTLNGEAANGNIALHA